MKLSIVVFALLLFAVTALGAQEKKKEPFWNLLQGKVQKLAPRKKNTAPAAVAGIKGSKNDRADIYWKGKEKKVDIDEDELTKFTLAMEYQEKGDKALALKHFNDFLREYPNSSLHGEGVQAVQLLKTELSAQPPAAATITPSAIAPAAVVTEPVVPATKNP
jgi:hypothetical protein